MKIFCCLDHIDVALDTIVDETGEPPFINEISAGETSGAGENAVDVICEYCGKLSVYMVAN